MIRLRPFKSSDMEALAGWLPDKRQFAMWSVDRFQYPLTTEQLEQYMQQLESEPSAWSMAALNEVGELVGHFAVKKVDYNQNSAHIGFIVVDPEQRGKGYGKAMVSQAVQYALEVLGVTRVTLHVMDVNKAAYACYTSLGFKEESRQENAYQFDGESWAVCLMAVER